jgi:hypothetical protein
MLEEKKKPAVPRTTFITRADSELIRLVDLTFMQYGFKSRNAFVVAAVQHYLNAEMSDGYHKKMNDILKKADKRMDRLIKKYQRLFAEKLKEK